MASIRCYTDQENRQILPGLRGKPLNNKMKIGPSKRSAGPTPHKQFGVQGKNTTVPGRTFGDISNRQHSNRATATTQKPPSKQAGYRKEPMQKTAQQTKVKAPVVRSEDLFLSDFFPQIAEDEDYNDVLPSHFELNHEQLLMLYQPWRALQRPKLPQRRCSSPSRPSPPLDVLPDCCWTECLLPLEPVNIVDDLPMMPEEW